MDLKRTLKHLIASGTGLRRAFDRQALESIEQTIAASETKHGGEIRFALENNLAFADLWRGMTPRERALQVFSQLGVWDTEANNGVLIYVLWCDHDVEIVADRGFNGRVTAEQWTEVCHRMEQLFANGDAGAACVEGIRGVGELIARHFPAVDRNEQPNRPVLL
jgi:uncharacterized membrane protein